MIAVTGWLTAILAFPEGWVKHLTVDCIFIC